LIHVLSDSLHEGELPMTLADRILEILQRTGAEWDDDQLAARLGVRRQHVNQVCRGLHSAGVIARHTGRDGKIVNRARESTATSSVASHSLGSPVEPGPSETASLARAKGRPAVEGARLITEDEVKQAVS